MATDLNKDGIAVDEKRRRLSGSSMSKEEAGIVVDAVDKGAERAYGTSIVLPSPSLPLSHEDIP